MVMVDPAERRIRNVALQLSLTLVLSSCAQVESHHSDSTRSERVETVNVVLKEWYVLADKMDVDEGDVNFKVHNQGRMEHEFIIIKTTQSMHDLPVNEKGLIEKKAGKMITEIEDLHPGETREIEVHMIPGSYVLFCNKMEMEDHKIISHYRKGMRVGFSVE